MYKVQGEAYENHETNHELGRADCDWVIDYGLDSDLYHATSPGGWPLNVTELTKQRAGLDLEVSQNSPRQRGRL